MKSVLKVSMCAAVLMAASPSQGKTKDDDLALCKEITKTKATPDGGKWTPVAETFKDVEHVARASEQLTLMALTSKTLVDIAAKADSEQLGSTYSITPVTSAPAAPKAVAATPVVAPPRAIRLSASEGGIGFDDLGFSGQLRKVLVPAGGSGRIDLIDPDSFAVTSTVRGASTAYTGGHGDGITSADSDGTRLFAIDRTSKRLLVVNPSTGALSASAPLAGHPDYVRWVGAMRELWVTEPDEERIEIFSLGPDDTLRAAGQLSVEGGPESLVIDETGKRAFTHLWKGVTLAIDVSKRSVLAQWSNGCRGSRGIAYDARDGIVFAACAEGRLVALDVNHEGRKLGSIATGDGVDVIAYNATLRHAYVPASKAAEMTVVGVSATGQLRSLRVVPTAKGAHCVAADDRAHAWVCDPVHGQLLLVTDSAVGPP